MRQIPLTILGFSAFLIACPAPQDQATPNGPGSPNPNMVDPNGGPMPGPQSPNMNAEEGMPSPAEARGDAPQGDAPQGDTPPQAEDLAPPVRGHVEGFSGNSSVNPDAKEAGEMVILQPIRNQETIRGGAHFALSGSVEGMCDGRLRIDVLSATPASSDAGQVGPLSAVDLDEVGAFEVLVPEGDTVELSAICDVDGDDRIGDGDFISAPGGAQGLSAAKGGLRLVLEPLAGVPNPEEGGQERD